MEKVVMLSLDDEKSKDISKVLSSDTARQILSYLASVDEASESEISEKLKIPISTVHYNITNLLNSGFVVSENFHYSQKGKTVEHYKVAEKLIMIVPSKKQKFSDILKSLIPAFISFAIVSVGSIIMNLFSKANDALMLSRAVPEMKDSFGLMSTSSLEENLVVQSVEVLGAGGAPVAFEGLAYWQWIMIGAFLELLIIITIFLVVYFVSKKGKVFKNKESENEELENQELENQELENEVSENVES
jgi:DNA-binding transcriptional ArsR family regulator